VALFSWILPTAGRSLDFLPIANILLLVAVDCGSAAVVGLSMGHYDQWFISRTAEHVVRSWPPSPRTTFPSTIRMNGIPARRCPVSVGRRNDVLKFFTIPCYRHSSSRFNLGLNTRRCFSIRAPPVTNGPRTHYFPAEGIPPTHPEGNGRAAES